MRLQHEHVAMCCCGLALLAVGCADDDESAAACATAAPATTASDTTASNTTAAPVAIGLRDVYLSARASTADPWSTSVNLGRNVNSIDAKSGAPGDGERLYFCRLGSICVTTRTR
jgi:hypothetical protein